MCHKWGAYILNGSSLGADERSGLAVKVVGHTDAQGGASLFRLVQLAVRNDWGLSLWRRLVVRVPAYAVSLCASSIKKLLHAWPIPITQASWYRRALI